MVYSGRMTLSVRNNFFRGGIIIAILSLGLIALGGYSAYPAFPEVTALAAQRSGGFIQKLVEKISEPASHVPFWTMIISVAYSLASITLIYNFFEKTHSPEILFIGFFVISLTFEFVRIIIPLKTVFPFPLIFIISAARILIFGRYFGLFSLFAASVYASGLDAKKQEPFLLLLILAAMIIAMNVPIDSLSWDSTFVLLSAYKPMFFVIETGIIIITVISFFVSAYTRGSQSYVLIGIGVFMAFAGRNILLGSDTWITPVPGLMILIMGTWFACSRLHLEYLWL
jgi:hypothetical protein